MLLDNKTKTSIEHSIVRTDRLYHQLIRNPTVFSLLELVRDKKRIELLLDRKADAFLIYGSAINQ